MKNQLLSLLLFLSGSAIGQQKIEWASKVLGYSSQLTPVQYSAKQSLGKPNVMPVGGQNPNAWMPKKSKKTEYIKLGFDVPMSIQQIAVAESFNPGALYKVYVYDETGKEYLVYTLDKLGGPARGFVRNIFVEKTPYQVTAVKLELAGKYDGEMYAIDAVAIADSPYPIVANVDLPKLLRKGIVVDAPAPSLNTEYNELNPILSPDGKTLYFSRCNSPENTGGLTDNQDIWFSEIQSDGSWGSAKNMRELNTNGPNFVNAVLLVKGKPTLILGNVIDKKGRTTGGVSKSTLTNGKWSAPKKLIIEDEYNTSEFANYFMSPSGVLLMSVERDDTHGARDLYVSFEKTDSTFTKPLNLGSIINTASDEISPFLASDDRTMFFSSSGFSGYGGNDIYVTHRLDNSWTNWSPPENLGPEINTKLDDSYFTLPKDGQYAYFSREVQPHNVDLVKARVPILLPSIKVKGRVLSKEKPVIADVVFTRENRPVGKTRSHASGEYELYLPGGYAYQFYAADNLHRSGTETADLSTYITQYDNEQVSVPVKTLVIHSQPVIVKGKIVDPTGRLVNAEVSILDKQGRPQVVTNNGGAYQSSLMPSGEYKVFVKNLSKKPDSLRVDFAKAQKDTLRMPNMVVALAGVDQGIAKAGDKTRLTGSNRKPSKDETGNKIIENSDDGTIHFFFSYKSAKLAQEFEDALNNTAEQLRLSKDLTARIDGHADSRGGEKYNLELSRRRAESVVNYLVKKGIDRSRLHIRVFGGSKPLVVSNDVEQNAKNRRVEIKIQRTK